MNLLLRACACPLREWNRAVAPILAVTLPVMKPRARRIVATLRLHFLQISLDLRMAALIFGHKVIGPRTIDVDITTC